MSFEVNLEKYAGPLHLLLELIEKQHLPITDVSLAQVTEDYLAYINTNAPPPLELADFLVMATRLLLIKSHAILPVETELVEEDATSLAAQLQLYQMFVRGADLIERAHASSLQSFARASADRLPRGTFELPLGCGLTELSQSFQELLKHLEPFFRLQESTMERVVSVKERLQEIHEALLVRSQMTFRDMIGAGRSKVDIVVSFLALLELVKQCTVRIVQSNLFGDIEIKRIE